MIDFRSDDDAGLEAAFDQARRHSPVPSADLLARIEADARTAQNAARSVPVAAPRRTGVRALLPAFGGWVGLAGLATSVVVGIGIGVWQPIELNLGTDQAEVDILDELLFLTFEDILAEG